VLLATHNGSKQVATRHRQQLAKHLPCTMHNSLFSASLDLKPHTDREPTNRQGLHSALAQTVQPSKVMQETGKPLLPPMPMPPLMRKVLKDSLKALAVWVIEKIFLQHVMMFFASFMHVF